MSIGKTILTSFGVLAFLGAGVLLYGHLYEGWRLDPGMLVGDLFSSREPGIDERMAARHWEVDLPDSSVIMIETDEIDLVVRGGRSGLTTIDAELEGDASDTARYRVAMARTDARTLHLGAGPVGPFTPPASRSRLLVTTGGPMKVMIRTMAGEVVLGDLRGDLVVTVEKGNIDVEGSRGGIRMKTLDGRITAQRCVGTIDVDAAGEVSFNYNEGRSTVAAAARVMARNHTGPLDITSAGGGIVASVLGLGSGCRMTSLAGDVRMESLPGIRATFEVSAPAGRIYYRLPFDTLREESPDATFLRARINGGGVPVTILARHGDVTLDEFVPQASLE